MRFFSGVVIGALIMIGAAYVHDTSIDPIKDPVAKAVVNWDVAAEAFRTAGDWVRWQVSWIGQQIRRQG